MKKIYKSIALTVTILGLVSCGNDWLDTKPADGIPTSEAITNYNDALTARTGMYDGLQGNSTYTSYYAARMFYYGDVRGEDMQARTQGMRSSSCYEMRYTVDDAPNMWNVPYNVLRRANRLIQAIDNKKVTDAKEEQIGKIYSEALVVRALVHFDLVRIYSMPYTTDNGASLGIPIILEPLEKEALPSRNTVAEVYTQVIKDLNSAINSTFLATGKTQGYINLWSAKALLARVYLTKGDNVNALATAEDIIKNSPYKLWTTEEYVDAWQKENGSHTNEMIFEVLNNSNDDWTDREGIAYLLNEDGYADAIVTKSFTEMLSKDPKDIRLDVILPALSDAGLIKQYGKAKIFINKFPADPKSGEMRLNSLPLLRLSEVYLNAAEAAVKLGNSQDKAALYLNAIVQRANPDAVAIEAANVTLERILIERRKELIGEGQRFFDAMRNNETITRYTDSKDQGYHYSLNVESRKFDRKYFRAILPIPVTETNVNANLKAQQNPGY